MAQSTVFRLRGYWLSVHKWIGISLAILIIPISVTGAALVWHDWLDAQINPQRYAVSTSEAGLSPASYAEAARARAGPDARLSQLRYPEDGHGPVLASLNLVREGRGGPPQRLSV